MRTALLLLLLLLASSASAYDVCPSGCPFTSIQAAVIDAETNDPNGVRRIAVGPGVYTERVTLSASTGSTFLFGDVSSDPLVSIVRIYPPADSVVAPTLTMQGTVEVANIGVQIGSDAGDVGIRIQGVTMTRLDGVTVNGFLPPGGRMIENIRTLGFVFMRDVWIWAHCENASATSAGYYENTHEMPYTETDIEGGYMGLFTNDCPAGAAVVQIDESSSGDDENGTLFRNVQLDCKANQNCIEIDGTKGKLDLAQIVIRPPLYKLVTVVGSGTTARVNFDNVQVEHETVPSTWGGVTPIGTLTVVGDTVPTMPCFPGWIYRRSAGAALGGSVYACDSDRTWKRVKLF